MGAKSLPVTPLRTLAWYKTDNLKRELARMYREFEGCRISGDWYMIDAIEMYLDHRRGAV